MYRKFVKISLAIVYLVIVAGAVVRMTGSGMGCPDWPKCFGYYIPPTTEDEITWKPYSVYFKGQIIVYNEALKVAQDNFTSTDRFNTSNWKVYEKHSYATFNATHTWIEYINRLLGALSGLAILIMTILSFRYWSKQKNITFVSIFTLLLLLFQAWLGATVVYSELLPIRITIHMLVALVITSLLISLLSMSKDKRNSVFTYNKQLEYLLSIGILLSLFQIAMGTQVRQAVDDSIRAIGYEGKSAWIDDPGTLFFIHRSFSIIVVLVNLGIWWINKKKQLNYPWTHTLLIILAIEVLSGIAMFYLNFPFGTQAMHLIFASLLFGLQFYIYRLVKQTRNLPYDL